MYTWQSAHAGANIQYRMNVTELDDALELTRELAELSAKAGRDALYRLFGPQGFVTAFSVLGGKVSEHASVTIPNAHW